MLQDYFFAKNITEKFETIWNLNRTVDYRPWSVD